MVGKIEELCAITKQIQGERSWISRSSKRSWQDYALPVLCPAPVSSLLRVQVVGEVEVSRVQVALNRRKRKQERAGEAEPNPVQLVPEKGKRDPEKAA
jgi:hypothetical protein